jgi:dephospho-CoA kinase
MIVLGLTGSIGMGKSTTARLFAEAGVPVYDADATVHKIYQGEAAPAIEAAFPGTTVNGKVDLVDVPLLFETGSETRVDAVVVVTTSPENQRERILARGTMANEALDALLARQMPDAEKRKRADFVVDTSHGLDPVRARIRDILAEAAKMPRRRA